MVQRRVLQCGLCRSKEKCLKPGLKCVNIWSISTVQRKRVPELWADQISKVAWLLKGGHQITKFGEFEIDPLPDWQPVQAP